MVKYKSIWLSNALLLLLLPLLMAGCTTVSSGETQLPMSSVNHCAEPQGISLKYGTLTIALGERPSAGFGIQMVGQQEDQGEYELIYRETRPQPGRMYAQVITQPCMQVILPKNWQQVTVKNQLTGEIWTLTPADDQDSKLMQMKKALQDK